MNGAALGAALLALAAGGAQERARPQRILSLNLCTDQLLLQLVDRERIAGVTFLAADPDLSAETERARGIPVTGATVEEVLLLRPDLALVGQYWTGEAIQALRRLRVPLVEVPPAESFAEVRRQIEQVAEAAGEPARARAILEAFDEGLRGFRAERPTRRPGAIVMQEDGTTYGRGTLADEVLSAAGFENLADALGIRGVGSLDLERLLLAGPRLLVTPSYRAGVPTLGRALLRHPALAGAGLARVSVPFSLLACGTTHTLRAVEQLALWRRAREAGP